MVKQKELTNILLRGVQVALTDLNYVDPIWNHAKYSDLANFIPDDTQHLAITIRSPLTTSGIHDPYLKHCFRHANLII